MERNTNVFCRSCLCSKQTFKYFIHQNVEDKLYTFCTSIKVSKDDQLTKALCNQCYSLLKKMSAFKQISIDSNLKLLTLFKNSLKDDIIQDISTPIEQTDEEKESALRQSGIKLESEPLPIQTDDEVDATECDYLFPKLESDEAAETEKRLKKKSLNTKATLKRKNMLKCEMCYTHFTDQDRYKAHLASHQGKIVPINCEPCNKTFKTWSGLRNHKTSVHDSVRLSTLACNICGKISKNKQSLMSHLYYHTVAKMVVCHVCGKEMRKSKLTAHMSTHEETRPRAHQCALCGNNYLYKGTLNKHVRRRHEGLRYTCDTCGASFSAKHALVTHFRRHRGERAHRCDFCQKAFYDKSSLTHHRRIHTGEKPFACTFCSKQFIAKKRLVEHIRTHSAEKPHKCHLCPQMFAQRGTLKRHLKVHEKNGPVLVNCNENATAIAAH